MFYGGYAIMIKQNDIAPDFSLPDMEGNILSLQENLNDGKNVLLVFLRHLG